MKMLLFLALLISLSFGMQHIFGMFNVPNYTPFALVGVSKGGSFDEACCYVPSINSVRFNKPLGDWQAFEYRNSPLVQPILGPVIFGNITKIIGLENLYIVVDFIFPSLIFLLFFYLANCLIKNELITVFVSILLLGKEALLTFFTKVAVSLLKYGGLEYFFQYLSSLNRPLAYARFDNPQFSFSLLIFGLLLFWKAMFHLPSRRINSNLAHHRPRSSRQLAGPPRRRFALRSVFRLFLKRRGFCFCLAGFILGLQWYVYGYFAIFASIVLFITFLILLIFRQWENIKLLFLAFVVFFTTAIYYWFNYLKFIHLPQAREFLLRAGREEGRFFDKKSIFVLLLITIFIFLLRKEAVREKKLRLLFVIVLLLAAAFCLNFPLLFGFTVQHFHWWPRVAEPMVLIGVGYLLGLLILSFPPPRSQFCHLGGVLNCLLLKGFFWTIILGLTLSIFFRNLFISINTYKAYSLDPKMHQAFEWINKNLEKNSVMMTPSIESNYLLLIYTHVYIFSPHGLHSLAATSQLVERMALTFVVFGVPESFAQDFIDYQQTIGTEAYTHQTLDLAGYPYLFYLKYGYNGPKSQEAQDEVAKSLQIFKTADLSLSDIRKKYKTDYLFFGPSEKRISQVNLEENLSLKKVYDNGEVKIFKILPTSEVEASRNKENFIEIR